MIDQYSAEKVYLMVISLNRAELNREVEEKAAAMAERKLLCPYYSDPYCWLSSYSYRREETEDLRRGYFRYAREKGSQAAKTGLVMCIHRRMMKKRHDDAEYFDYLVEMAELCGNF